MRRLAWVVSVILTLAAAAGAALIVAPSPSKTAAFLTIVLDEKSFLLVAAALLGAVLARIARGPAGSNPRGRGRGWVRAQALLALGTTGLAAVPPVQAARLAAREGVALDYRRYLSAAVDTGDAHPAQTVIYGSAGGQKLALDLYRPTGTTGADTTGPAGAGAPGAGAAAVPAVIVIHGGGWSTGDKGDAPLTSAWLAAHGYAVFDIQYRLNPPPTWRAAIGDVKCAIGWVKRHAREIGVNVDPERIALLGRSAGAHLALLVAYAPDDPKLPASCDAGDTRVAAVISFYGPTDLAWGYQHPSAERVYDSSARLERFLGGTPDTAPGPYLWASVTTHVTAAAPRTLLIHGGRDQFVFAGHSELLDERLGREGVAHRLLIIPYAQHGFDFVFGGLGGQIAESAMLRLLAGGI
jgi:acetyl esterase/lipase